MAHMSLVAARLGAVRLSASMPDVEGKQQSIYVIPNSLIWINEIGSVPLI
jgi:hypothetical protein